jgi:hypothetical protein
MRGGKNKIKYYGKNKEMEDGEVVSSVIKKYLITAKDK